MHPSHEHDAGHGHHHSHGPIPAITPAPDPSGGDLISNQAAARLFSPIQGRLLTGAVLSFLSGFAALAPYIAVAEVAKLLLSTGPVDSEDAWRWVVIGIVGAAVRIFMLLGAAELTHFADADLQRLVRGRLIRHVGRLPLGWLGSRGSAELKRAMEDDIEDMHHLVAHALNDLASAVGTPIAALTYMYIVDWRMATVVVVLLGTAMIFVSLSMRQYPERVNALTRAQRQINAATIEYVDGIEVVKAFGEKGDAFGRFTTAVNHFGLSIRDWTQDIAKTYSVSMFLLSPSTALWIILAAGTGSIGLGWLQPVDLLPFLLVGVGLATPFTAIGQGVQNLRRARLAATHVAHVLDAKPLAEPQRPRQANGNTVEFDRVNFSYGGNTPTIRDLTATCAAGTVTAIVGPSGSGKTTMTRLIPRFMDVDSGAVRIGGVDNRSIQSSDLLASVAMVFQDVVLLRDTVRENIRLGRPTATDTEVEDAATAAQIHAVITRLPDGYDTVIGEAGGFLSGGERQRVTIARAILQDAPIVILDEATAYADPENEAAVQDALTSLITGRTVLVIAHRLHTIVHADQILVLDAGELVERGTHAELLAQDGLYARLWSTQEEAIRSAELELTALEPETEQL